MGDLFTGQQTLDDLAHHIKLKADRECETFNIAFGFWKNKKGTIGHAATVMGVSKHGKHFAQTIEAFNTKDMFTKVDEFFKSIQ